MHLFKRKSKRERTFRRVAGEVSGETLAAESGNFGVIGIEGRFHGIERGVGPGAPRVRPRSRASSR